MSQNTRAKIILILFIAGIATSIFISLSNYFRVKELTRDNAIEGLAGEARLIALRFLDAYDEMRNDGQMVAHTPPIKGLIRASRNNDIDPKDGSTTELWRSRLETIFISIMQDKPQYTQMRYIGIADNGKELARVNRTDSGLQRVSPNMLQEKKAEPYVKQAQSLLPGEFSFSNVTYNREQGKIDKSFTPTIRLIFPIFSNENQIFGMVIINANYEIMLQKQFHNIQSKHMLYVVNHLGDYIYSDPEEGISPLKFHDSDLYDPPYFIKEIIDKKPKEEVFSDDKNIKYFVRQDISSSNQDAFIGIILKENTQKLLRRGREARNNALLISLTLGFMSLLAALVLIRWYIRIKSQEDFNDNKVLWSETKALIYAGTIILVILSCSVFLWKELKEQENNLIQQITHDDLTLVSNTLTEKINSKIVALERMSQRWEIDKGENILGWRADARNYVEDFFSLTTVEFVDETYHIKLVEPIKGNEKVIGLNILFNEERRNALEGAAQKDAITLTPPIKLLQGYNAIIAYAPITIDNKFNGFMVGLYDIDKLISETVPLEFKENYIIEVIDGNEPIYSNRSDVFPATPNLATNKIQFFDRTWDITITPKNEFIAQQQNYLDEIVLYAGILLSFMAGFAVYSSILTNKRSTELKIKTSQLEYSEKQTRSILENAIDGIITITADGIVETYNPACKRIFGYNAEEVVNKNVRILMPEPYHSKHDGYLKHYRQTGNKKIIGLGRKVQGRRKDGSIFPMDLSISEVNNGNKRIFTGMVRDISERTKAEKEREKLIRDLEISNKELDNFAYVASHDLKAPLRVIDNASQWLEEDLEQYLNDDTRETMCLLRNRVARMEKLLDDLLEYSRIGRTTAEQSEDKITGRELLDDIVGLISSDDRFQIAGDKNLENIYVNRMPLQQILLNLINNAIKHHHQKTGHIILSAEEQEDCYIFKVTDDGPGIPKEYHERIFGMFQTLKPRDQVEGSGMGLAIVLKNVEIYGGEITLKSDTGKGSTFTIKWPKEQELLS